MSQLKSKGAFITSALAVMALSACSPASPVAGGQAAPRDSIVVADSSGIQDWNPLSAAGDTTIQRQQQWALYPHPFIMKADTAVEINEALLVSAEVTQTDPHVVTYTIQPDAVWSDGEPITAADFQYTHAVQDPRECADCTAAFTEGYSLISEVRSLGEGKTVEVEFEESFAQWQTLFGFLLPAHVAEGYGDLAESFNVGFSQNVPTVSGGPYVVEDFKQGVSLTLAANEKWYGQKPGFSTVTFKEIKGVNEQVTALQNGEIDVMLAQPSIDTVSQIESLTGYTSQIAGALTYQHLGMRTTGGVMGDATFRKALALAIDLDAIRARTVEAVAPEVPPMNSAVYVPGQRVGEVEAYQDNFTALQVGRGEPDKALAVLQENGYTLRDGKLLLPDGTPVPELVFLTEAANQSRVETAQLVQQQLEPLGLSVAIDSADASRYAPSIFDAKFDLMVTGTALDLGSISLQQWYGTEGGRSFGYSDPEVDQLFDEAYAATDPQQQVEVMNAIDKILLADHVVMPLNQSPRMVVYPDWVEGIELNPGKYGITVNIEHWKSS